ncbi:unnamed protein product [Peniophora sp. CBMAI 1063]|nr:unnamed protein product [Peniophora sp. CBMAI 1063]
MSHSHNTDHTHDASCVSGNVLDLIRPIRKVITAPDVDLKTINAKEVRRRLVEGGYADEAFLTAKKAAVNELILAIFNQATGVPGAEKVYESDEEA